jgi:hypothetical protein
MTTVIRPTTRYFNEVEIDLRSRTIVKRSTSIQALRDEYEWYGALPTGLRDVAPRVHSWHATGAEASFRAELIPWRNLAQHAQTDDLVPHAWSQAIGLVFELHDRFRSHAAPLPAGSVRAMYVDKTIERLDQLCASSAHWRELLSDQHLTINGRRVAGIPVLLPRIEAYTRHLVATAHGTVIHGDFCFSNILVAPDLDALRVIDPRGRFGRKGIHGDPRYDAAKLRHSAVGGYDHIASDRFRIRRDGPEILLDVDLPPGAHTAGELCDRALRAAGYDLQDIAFLEALLFLSMTPLHADAPDRQLALLATGLLRMHEVQP